MLLSRATGQNVVLQNTTLILGMLRGTTTASPKDFASHAKHDGTISEQIITEGHDEKK
jgi:hypothetical protein